MDDDRLFEYWCYVYALVGWVVMVAAVWAEMRR